MTKKVKTEEKQEETNELTLNINGKSYLVSQLPTEVQQLVEMYSTWEVELKPAKMKVFQIEAALKMVLNEINARIAAMESMESNDQKTDNVEKQ